MKIKLITKTLAAFLLLISVFTSGLLYGDVEKDNIRAVQQVLKDCGFNPGSIDGIWGNKTTAAAKSFVQAHGGSPEAANYVILMVKVDAYRVGDAGPCPPEKAAENDETDTPKTSQASASRVVDEVDKQNTREVQQVLKDCGFNPGSVDGTWGDKTHAAAKAYVRAHGGSPNTDGYSILVEKMLRYNVGDANLCPPAGSNQAASESRPTEEAGSVEADQAEESEVGGGVDEEKLIAEVRRTMERSRTYTDTNYNGTNQNVYYKGSIEISDDAIRLFVSTDKQEWSVFAHANDSSDERSHEMKLSDIGEVIADDYGLQLKCRKDRECVHFELIGTGIQRPNIYIVEDSIEKHTSMYLSQWLEEFLWDKDEVEHFANVLNNLIAYYDQDTATRQPAKCYNWVNLGRFHLGTWKNSYGRETGSLSAGLSSKIWNDGELRDNYETIRNNHCVSGANNAMDSAISAMVLVGRQAADVEAERKRIKTFYQTSLDKCQAYFDSKYRKYEGKFCH